MRVAATPPKQHGFLTMDLLLTARIRSTIARRWGWRVESGSRKTQSWDSAGTVVWGLFLNFSSLFFAKRRGPLKPHEQLLNIACSPEKIMNLFFIFAWGLGIEKGQGFFGELFVVSVSWETKHEKY